MGDTKRDNQKPVPAYDGWKRIEGGRDDAPGQPGRRIEKSVPSQPVVKDTLPPPDPNRKKK